MSYALLKNENWDDVELNTNLAQRPSDWKVYTIGDVTESKIQNKTPDANAVFTYIDIGSVNNVLKKVTGARKMVGREAPSRARQCVHPGDVLVSTTRPNLNAVALLSVTHEEDHVCSTGFEVLRAKQDILSSWLFALVRSSSFVSHVSTLVEGALYPTVSGTTIKNYQFVLPNKEEQTAIANILSDQEALVAHYNDLIALHEKRFAYLSDELLSGRLRLKVDKNQLSFRKNNDDADLRVNGIVKKIPTEWTVKKVHQLFDLRAGGDLDKETYSPVKTIRCAYPIYSNSVSERGLYGFDSNAHSDGDTITVTARGTLGVAFYRSEPYTPIGRLLVMTKKEDMRVQFFEYVINHTIDIIMEQTSIPQLTAPSFNRYDLVVPPLEEQTLIANVLSDQEALIAEYKKLRDAEKKRFDWLSDALLSGTYRVKMEA